MAKRVEATASSSEPGRLDRLPSRHKSSSASLHVPRSLHTVAAASIRSSTGYLVWPGGIWIPAAIETDSHTKATPVSGSRRLAALARLSSATNAADLRSSSEPSPLSSEPSPVSEPSSSSSVTPGILNVAIGSMAVGSPAASPVVWLSSASFVWLHQPRQPPRQPPS